MIEQINSKAAVPAKKPRLLPPGSAARGFRAGLRGMGRGVGGMGFGARGRPTGWRGGPMRGQWLGRPRGGPMPPALAIHARGGPMAKQGAIPPWMMARGRAARVGRGGMMQMAPMQQQMMAAAMQQQMAAAAAGYNDYEYGGEEEYEVEDEYDGYEYDDGGDDAAYDWSSSYENPYNMFMPQQQNMMPPAGNQFWQAGPGPARRPPIRRPLRVST